MRTLTRFALSIGGAALLAACGGFQPARDDPQLPYYLYAIAPKNSELHIYPLSGTDQREVGHIDGLPAAHGIATDTAGDLYVTVSARSQVRVYVPMAKEPFLILKDRVGTDVPWGVAVSRAGEVAVTNNESIQPYRASHVSFFHAGATHPYATFKNLTSFAECIWDAYDDAGNLYVVGQSADGHATLGEVARGGNGRELRDLHVSGLSRSLGGVEVDGSGDVVVAQAARLTVFAPHSNRVLRTITYGRGLEAKALVLTPSRSDFYVANDRLNPAQLWEYKYPSGGVPVNKIRVVPQGHPPIVEVSGLAIGMR